MRLKVSTQVGSVGKGAIAELTGKRLLTGVGSKVTLKQPGSREGLSAEFALAGQCVRADVHLEGTQ